MDELEVEKKKEFEKYKQGKKRCLIKNSYIPMKLRKMIHPLLHVMLLVSRKSRGYKIEVINKPRVVSNRPVIYAVSHIGKFDFEIVSEIITQQVFVLAADFVHTKGTFSGFFLWMNGVVYIDVLDKEDRKNSRNIMVKIAKQGGNIMIFPEGTWNLSPNEIVYDIQLGTVDIAMETGAVILPISVEQYEEEKKFVVNAGDIIEVKQRDDREYKIKKTQELRDAMATLKYEIWEREGIVERNTIKINHWENFILHRCKEWPQYTFREQIDNCYIPREKTEYWEVIRDVKNMKIREVNKFLFMQKDDFLAKQKE